MSVAKPRAILALLATLACAASPFVASRAEEPAPALAPPAPAADAALEAEARALLAGLAGDDSNQRQAAEDGLVEMGDAARPVIEALLAGPAGDDLEVRTRLESALTRIGENRLTGPSYVTLSLKDAAPADALSELSKQASAPIRPTPDDLWQQRHWPPVTLNLRRKPFWEAALALTEQAGLGFLASNDGLRVVQGPGQISGPSVVHGPFLVVATQVNRTQTIMLGKDPDQPARPPIVRGRSNDFGVYLIVLPEPKLSVIRVNTGVKLERAVDDKGNDLAPPAGAGGQSYASGMPGAWHVYARLNHAGAAAGTKIESLAGTITFVVQTASERIEIPDPLTLKDAFRVVGGSRITFQEMAKNGERYELRVSMAPDGNAPAPAPDGMREISSLFQSVQSGLRVFDAAGRPLERRGFSSEGSGRAMRCTLHFAEAAAAGGGGGPPARLVWDVPTESKDVDVPFEFNDLPIP